MYTTADEVMAVTPYTDVTNAEVAMAQFVIEVFTGRLEGEVDGARDKGLLARATIAQTVYMRENPAQTYEQIAVSTVQTNGELSVFKDGNSPFIAPLAVMACKRLSWNQSRSVRFGRIFARPKRTDWSRD